MIISTEIFTIFHKIIIRFIDYWSCYSYITSKIKIFLKNKIKIKDIFFFELRFCFGWLKVKIKNLIRKNFSLILLTLGADRTLVKSKKIRHELIMNRTMIEDCMIMLSCFFEIKYSNECYSFISNVVFIKTKYLNIRLREINGSFCVGCYFPLFLSL